MRNDYCSNYLEHSAKGKTWANHKYVAKVKLPSGRMFYFYNVSQYQAYLKRQGTDTSSKGSGQMAKAEPYKEMKSTLSRYSSMNVQQKRQATSNMVSTGKSAGGSFSAKVSSSSINSTETKKAAASGKAKTDEVLSKANGTNTDAKAKSVNDLKSYQGSSKSSKKNGKSSSSSSSKKKSGSGKKSSSSSKSGLSKKSSGEKSSKEKTSSGKSSKESATKSTEKETTKVADVKESSTSVLNNIKRINKVADTSVNKHENMQKLLTTLKSYDDGAFGYIKAGNKVYKWSKSGGNITFVDFDTDKKVNLNSALKNIEEFRTDKQKRKK